jgi:hypothetical protein
MAFGKSDGIAVVEPANFVRATFKIRGTAPLVMNKFSAEARAQMMAAMSTPKAAKKSKAARPPRDFSRDFEEAKHISTAGWIGMPCVAFRAAMVDACRTVGLVMTKAKMAVFVVPEGFDRDEGSPLVRVQSEREPERLESFVRNDTGVADIRIRPMWRQWGADVTVEFDADMISIDSVVNLLDRAGRQVGIGAGRPFSTSSVGQGWGTFEVITGDGKETRQ